MSAMVIILIGFMAGLMTMATASVYKWALKYFNEGFK